jgi:hypothetical protein
MGQSNAIPRVGHHNRAIASMLIGDEQALEAFIDSLVCKIWAGNLKKPCHWALSH